MIFSSDGAFLKPGSGFHGQLLTLSGIDSSARSVAIGYAIVSVENAENYTWFFELVGQVDVGAEAAAPSLLLGILNTASTVIFSDRGVLCVCISTCVWPICRIAWSLKLPQ